MHIRRAKVEDYSELMHLYNAFVGNQRYSKYDSDSFKKVLESPKNFIFVAQVDAKLVGFAAFSVRDVVRYPKPIAELDELFVSVEYREKGVGRELMEQMEETARELDCYRVFIESHFDHKKAHKFYEGIGYKNYGFHFIKDL